MLSLDEIIFNVALFKEEAHSYFLSSFFGMKLTTRALATMNSSRLPRRVPTTATMTVVSVVSTSVTAHRAHIIQDVIILTEVTEVTEDTEVIENTEVTRS